MGGKQDVTTLEKNAENLTVSHNNQLSILKNSNAFTVKRI
jgi:hypothetical protein